MPIPRCMGGGALKAGLFEYFCVQFYNNSPCQYSSRKAANLKNAWKQWISSFPAKMNFLGLPGAPDAAGSGFIPANVLISKFLPTLKRF